MITLSPAHQNPSKAPPNPIDLEHSKDSPESLEQYYKDAANATESSAGVTPNRSRNSPRTLLKRGSGPLYCKDGPLLTLFDVVV
jgi:chitinase